MSVWCIGDLHLSFGADKPMEVFGENWSGHYDKIADSFKKNIKPNDTVVLCGDISWSMNLNGAIKDFEFINNLPGEKIIIKGNHDYWWTTYKKMNRFLTENKFDTIKILSNNSFETDNIIICGTRGWNPDISSYDENDRKVLAREVNRLSLSLESAKSNKEKVVFLHYPPLYDRVRCDDIINTLKKHNVKRCYYGHIHSASISKAVEGTYGDIAYKLISADYVDFSLVCVENS